MAILRSRNNLGCWYCGQKSGLRFQGQQSFVCTRCEATNWLDQNGRNIHPPTEVCASPHDPIQYAVPQDSRFPSHLSGSESGPSESIFCATCLRNQRMVTESLRQYEFPDDPYDPEYLARERTYRKWRQDLEDRYPQMCAQCEPKVQEKLDQASYTAKTDHLRRMMDRTRSRRKEVKQRGFLDLVDAAGRWSWHIGFALQLLWHITILCSLFATREIPDGPGARWLRLLTAMCGASLAVLPAPARFIQWAISMGMCSFPWNPRFKQTMRGFTAHIIGFRQWYTYQLMILFVRYVCLFISQYARTKGLPAETQLAAHAVIAALMFYLHGIAGKSLKTDNTPLFGTGRRVQTSKYQTPQKPQPVRDPNDLGSILDDIGKSTPALHATPAMHATPYETPQTSFYRPSRTSPHLNGPFALPQRPQAEPSFGALKLSDSPPFTPARPREPVYDYTEEMDWTPSGSQHRAFSTHNPFKVKNPNPRFSDAPIEEKPGPFWYKVPPAPTTPAQRLRNPPMRPIIRESPKETTLSMFRTPPGGPINLGAGASSGTRGFTLQEPKFYAPEAPDDPREGLSRMMGSFNISPDPDDEAFGGTGGGAGVFGRSSRAPRGVHNNGRVRLAELVVLCGAWWAWISALKTTEEYGLTVALGAVVAELIISIRVAADLLADVQLREGQAPGFFGRPWLANLGVCQVVATLALLWGVWSSSWGGHAGGISLVFPGHALFGVVLAHQLWHVC